MGTSHSRDAGIGLGPFQVMPQFTFTITDTAEVLEERIKNPAIQPLYHDEVLRDFLNTIFGLWRTLGSADGVLKVADHRRLSEAHMGIIRHHSIDLQNPVLNDKSLLILEIGRVRDEYKKMLEIMLAVTTKRPRLGQERILCQAMTGDFHLQMYLLWESFGRHYPCYPSGDKDKHAAETIFEGALEDGVTHEPIYLVHCYYKAKFILNVKRDREGACKTLREAIATVVVIEGLSDEWQEEIRRCQTELRLWLSG